MGNQGRGAGTSSQIKHHKMFMIADARSLHPSSIAGSLLGSPGQASSHLVLPHICIPCHPCSLQMACVGGCKETLLNYDPFTENKSQWCVPYDHVCVLYGTGPCTALALRIPGFQHLLCCSSFPQSRLDTRPDNISESAVIRKKGRNWGTLNSKTQCTNLFKLRMWVIQMVVC